MKKRNIALWVLSVISALTLCSCGSKLDGNKVQIYTIPPATSEKITTVPKTVVTTVKETTTVSAVTMPSGIVSGKVINNETKFIEDAILFKESLDFYGSSRESFQNPNYLAESGRFVTVCFSCNYPILDIETKICFYNPESNSWIDCNDYLEREVTTIAEKQFISFKIPDNPYIKDYSKSTENIIITFSIDYSLFFSVSY